MTEKDLWAKRFGDNLSSIIPKNMSIAEFSRRCDIDKTTMSSYIYGKRCPSAWAVIKIARALGRPVTDVLDYFY